MDKDDVVYLLETFLLFVLVPIIPGILLWFILVPETFWERLITVGFGAIIWYVILRIELRVMTD